MNIVSIINDLIQQAHWLEFLNLTLYNGGVVLTNHHKLRSHVVYFIIELAHTHNNAVHSLASKCI